MYELAFGALAAVVLGGGLIQLYREMRPRYWPKIDGTIVSAESQIKMYTIEGGQAAEVVPIIKFQYTWRGQTYCKDANIYSSGYEPAAKAIMRRYPVGKSVTVMVNPKDPSKAKIESKITPGSWGIILIGIMLTIGVYAFCRD